MPDITKSIKDIEIGIGLISDGLLYLDQNQEVISNLMGPHAVDIAARLNAQYNALDKKLDILKANLKSNALSHDQETIRGNSYIAIVKRVVKNVVDVEKVREYFKTSFPQFQKKQESVTINFDVKG